MKGIILAATLRALAVPSAGYDTVRFLAPLQAPEMEEPVAAAWAPGRLYVLDAKRSSLLIFSMEAGEEKLIKVVGRKGSGAGAFSDPRGLAVGPDKIYVADTGNSRIQVFDREGTLLGAFGSKGSEPGRLKGPRSVALGGDGRVFVADTGNDRVAVFTEEGIFLHVFGTPGGDPGQLKSPSRLAVDAADRVYVLDSGNERIQVFDAGYGLLREISMLGSDFALDDYGFVHVLDGKGGKMFKHGLNGQILGKFGSKGSGPGQFRKAEGVAAGAEGQLLILDTGNKRILRAEVPNKVMAKRVEPNRATRLLIKGPSAVWPLKADALSVLDDKDERLYAYLPEEGQFAVLGRDGKEVQARFGVKSGKGPSVTRGSAGLAASPKHGLYVSDTPSNRLQVFSLEGAWQRNLAEKEGFFESGKKEGRVREPLGIAINDEGSIYVADLGNRRVDAFSPEGFFIFGIGPTLGSFELSEPNALAWDNKGFLYFTDKGLKSVFKVEPSGNMLTSFGSEGSGPGQFLKPRSLAFDGRDYLYVLDSELRRVSVYTRHGAWVTDLFSGGESERELEEPVALAVMAGKLLVADKAKGIVSFELRPRLAPPVSVSTAVKEGSVALAWAAAPEAWAARYRVSRATDPAGPYAEVGLTEKPAFKDSHVVPYQSYAYRVATESSAGDIGPWSPAVEVLVPGAFNKAPVEISTAAIGNLFAANYKWYLKNPVGAVTLTNNVNMEFQNLKLSFRLKDFMDFSTDIEIKSLAPRETLELPLRATLNNKILEVSEDTPIQAEFSLTYYESGKVQTVTVTKPLRVYSRNAITWDVPERIANFITPKDTPVLEFARQALREPPASDLAEPLNRNLLSAVHLWNALADYGVAFFSPPNNPYEKVSEDPNFPVDATQFPRETLKRKSGECDDLVTLIASMLEGARVRTALLDYPGHLALMFDAESDDPLEVGLPESELVRHDGTLWIPLEATLVGKPFAEARANAAYAYRTENEKGRVKVIDVHKAWADFEPASLPPEELAAAPAPSAQARRKRFESDASGLARERYEYLKKHYEAALARSPKDADAFLELALIEHQSGRASAGAEGFKKVLALEPEHPAALNNLGNVEFLRGDMAAAEALYLKAAAADHDDPDIWLNLVRAQLRLGNKAKARGFADKAIALDEGLKPAVESMLMEAIR